MNKKRYIIFVIAIISFGLLLTGGTYAWLTFSNVTINGQANGTSTCFLIDYITGSSLTGTLFQSMTPKGGLAGSVSMAISSQCSVPKAKGTLILNINSNSSDILFRDSALKYAVYTSSTATTPVNSGVINSKNSAVTLYTGFDFTSVATTLYVYVWLDGTIANNDYIDVLFSGYITASAVQTE